MAAFRVLLRRADGLRSSLLLWAHGRHSLGFLLTLGVAAIFTAIAASLVRRFAPESAGSGIPQVELGLKGRRTGDPLRIIPVKFVGGLLSIGRETVRSSRGSLTARDLVTMRAQEESLSPSCSISAPEG